MHVVHCSSYSYLRLRPVHFRRLRPYSVYVASPNFAPIRLPFVLAMGRKRKECPPSLSSAIAVIDSHVAVNAVFTALSQCSDKPPTSCSLSWCRKLAHDVLYADAETDTPLRQGMFGVCCKRQQRPIALVALEPICFLVPCVHVVADVCFISF